MYLVDKTSWLQKIVWICFVVLLFAACTTVKEYQPYKPFVYSNKIILKGDVSKDENKRLSETLINYWDDSLQVRKEQRFGFFYRLRKPPVFDTLNVSRSVKFMTAYLRSQGYHYATVKDSTPIKIDTSHTDQYRVNLIMKVNLGKQIKIDSVTCNLYDTTAGGYKDSSLQQLAMQNFGNTYLKKGEPYKNQVILNELDRNVIVFRKNGYYKLTRDDIYAYVDSTDDKLLKLTLDPFELAKLIDEAAKKRKENPTWDIAIRQREITDSSRLIKYHIGNVYYYPEYKLSETPDSLITQKWDKQITNRRGTIFLRDHEGKFILRPLREHTYLRNRDIYNEELFYKSLNALAQIPAWKQVDTRIIIRDVDSLDIHVFLEPQKKYQTTHNLETSRNTGDFTAGNLLGFAYTATLLNRNVWKRAIQSATSLRAGIELNLNKNANELSNKIIQTFQIGVGHSYSFPRLILPDSLNRRLRTWDNKRTIIPINASYTERYKTYRLRSFTGSWGYEGTKNGKKNPQNTWTVAVKAVNVELYKIDTLPGLEELFALNPFLRNSFNTGNVIGFLPFSVLKNIVGKNPNNTHYIRFGFDQSGLLTSFIKGANTNIYTYAKFELEYKYSHKTYSQKTETVLRFFSGVGIPKKGKSLPFFKQFYAGGPNSMRAWGLRQLGLGSSKLSDTIPITSFRDRFGDVQLEANAEYRFNIATFGSFKIGSALFADAGNVWNLSKNDGDPDSEVNFKRLWKDIAVALGTSIRFDFNYFLIRVDFAIKAKDPGRASNGGWMSIDKFTWKEKRDNVGQTEVRNYGFQLGIGLPF